MKWFFDLRLINKIGLLFIVFFVIFLALFIIGSRTIIRQLLTEHYTADTQRSLDAVMDPRSGELARMQRQAYDAARWFEHSGRLADALKKSDRTGIIEVGTLAMRSFGMDYFVVTDTTGKVIVRAHAPDQFGDYITNQRNIRNALDGTSSVGIEEGAVVKYSIRAGSPVRSGDRIIGVVSTGYMLANNEFVDRMKRQINCDVTIFKHDTRIATTIETNGIRITGTRLEHTNIIDTVIVRSNRSIGTATILGVPYIAAYAPFIDHDGKSSGMIFVGKNTHIIDDLTMKLTRNVGIVIAIAFLACLAVLSIAIRIFIARPIAAITRISTSIAAGDLTSSINQTLTMRADEIGMLAKAQSVQVGSFAAIIGAVKRLVVKTRTDADHLASSMTQSAAAVTEMTASIKSMEKHIGTQHALVERTETDNIQLKENAFNITRAIKSISKKMSELTQMLQANAASIQQMASSVEEMTATIASVTAVAEKANVTAVELSRVSSDSRELLEKTGENMDGVLRTVGVINDFVGIISNVAAQTNLLAMNAAIEAAHAGEHGRGFAVVAEEIRKLSDIANRQAEDARHSLKDIENSMKSTANDLNETESNFSIVADESKKILSVVTQVKSATEEQTAGSREMMSAISSISTATVNIKTRYDEIATSLASMKTDLDSFDTVSGETALSVRNLRSLSDEIKSSILEMGRGAEEIAASTQDVLSLTMVTSESIHSLEDEVKMYRLNDEQHLLSSDDFLDRAIGAHRMWKMKLLGAVNGSAIPEHDTVAADNRCDLGKWIHNAGMRAYGTMPEFIALREHHTAFHTAAGAVCELLRTNKKTQTLEEIETGAFAVESEKTIAAIEVLQKHMKLQPKQNHTN